jgi:hypothetical protein
MYNSQTSFDKIFQLDNIFSFWYFNKYLRIAYVSKGWLTVWDHRNSPPTRHDCKNTDHNEACQMAIAEIRALTT